MPFSPKSIAEQIDCLARLTDAPESFVSQVRELFERKGISLDEDAAPYVRALEEAFVREESIRIGAQQAAADEATNTDRFVPLAGSVPPRTFAGPGEGALRGTARQPFRGLVTPKQRDDVPMVPGPDEIQ
jgi:hypothetical protein